MPQTERIVRHIIALMPDPIAVVDRRAVVKLLNPAAEEMLRLAPGTAIHDSLALDADASGKLLEFLGHCLSTVQPVPTRIIRPSAGDAIVYGTRLDLPGDRHGKLVLLRFDQRLQLAAKFAVLNDELSDMTDRARHHHSQKSFLQDMVIRDPLTQVLNRRGFEQLMSREFKRARRHGRRMSMAVLDLDHFKSINDRHGHQVGDKVLQHFAALCQDSVRQEDYVARIGGEEFAVVMPETNLLESSIVIDRLIQTVKSTSMSLEDFDLTYSVSAGVSQLRQNEDLSDLINRADANLYIAKENGRGRYVSDRPSSRPAVDETNERPCRPPGR
ncbi:diguanylate cyclase [Roseibium sp.]|uniref:sensor domain-containing diguanylate cyclase n=1 Tax=Roseibium sp. TaxID=1936156 RepID=UPI003A96E718